MTIQQFIIVLHFCLFSVISFNAKAAHNPIENNTKTILVVHGGLYHLDLDARFSESSNHLFLETEDRINNIKIYNAEGKLQYQLPVQSYQIKLGKSLFEEGDYILAFSLSNQNSQKFKKIKVL